MIFFIKVDKGLDILNWYRRVFYIDNMRIF